jgi:hypothetical protein
VTIQVSSLPHQRGPRDFFNGSRGWLIFLGILSFYALAILPTLDRLGIGWDEATDFVIAEAYQTLRGMFLGLSWDLSQTRLPMFTVAVVFRLFGTTNLMLARLTTVVLGGLTLLGLFVLGRKRFTLATGLVAAGLLAINPFFLSFARLAFTESDIYVACTLIWLLVALTYLEARPSLGWAMLSGLLLSLVISSKATALLLVPVVCAGFVWSQMRLQVSTVQPRFHNLDYLPSRSIALWSGWTILITMAGVFVSRQLNAGSYGRILHLANYGIVCIAWLTTLVWAARNRNSTSHPVALAAFLAGICLLTFVIIPPEHLTNSGIISSLISRADEEMTFSPGFVLELAALHTFILFLKSTPVLGLGLLAALLASLAQWRRPELATPLMLAIAYLATLLALPLAQTFYTVPLLPILSLLAADQLLRLWSKRREISLALIAVGLIWWGVEMKVSYPDYHLNGYQWLGARPFFGRSSIGYRSIVYIPLDGVQQAMVWLNSHAGHGQIVLLYAAPWYIIETLAPDPVYMPINGFTGSLDSKPDFVVIHIGSTIRQGEGSDTPGENIFEYPFDYRILQHEYEKVFSVQRAFRIEMASIWKRK